SARTFTLVPGFQYSFGRQCTEVSFSSHAHEPSVSGVVSMRRAFSTAALSFTGASNVRETGMATPLVLSSPTFDFTLFVEAGLTVVNEPSIGTVSPSPPTALPDHV